MSAHQESSTTPSTANSISVNRPASGLVVFTWDPTSTVRVDDYWECGCRSNQHHHVSTASCPVCGRMRDTSPRAQIEDVVRLLLSPAHNDHAFIAGFPATENQFSVCLSTPTGGLEVLAWPDRTTVLVNDFWDCGCPGEEFHRHKTHAHCDLCDSDQDEWPNARLDELVLRFIRLARRVATPQAAAA